MVIQDCYDGQMLAEIERGYLGESPRDLP